MSRRRHIKWILLPALFAFIVAAIISNGLILVSLQDRSTETLAGNTTAGGDSVSQSICWVSVAETLYSHSLYEEAAEAYWRVIEDRSSPTSSVFYARLGIGMIYLERGDAEARKVFETLLSEFPDLARQSNIEALLQLAQHVQLPLNDSPAIRVLISPTDCNSVTVSSRLLTQTGFQVGDWVLRPGDREGCLTVSQLGLVKSPALLIPGSEHIRIGRRPYRGSVKVSVNRTGDLEVINVLGLEEYLYGVVPSEMPSKAWGIEALKAQAVAARSYALYRATGNKVNCYDLESTARSQVYGGVEAERERSTQAVIETRGLIMVGEDGKPIQAVYHADSGGLIDAAKEVWGIQDPHMISHMDKFSVWVGEGDEWDVTMEKTEIRRRLNSRGFRVGTIDNISVVRRTPMGRAKTVRIDHSEGTEDMRGNDFRLKMGLKSTLFKFIDQGERIRFSGWGSGHGVGMSQYGAYAMAKEGLTMEDILSYYYAHVRLMRL